MSNLSDKHKNGYYLGVMSGTSADGIDLALVELSKLAAAPRLVASFYRPYLEPMRSRISSLYQPGANEIDRAFHLDVALAHLFSEAIFDFLKQQKLTTNDIVAVGNHGQTLRHRPSGDNPFTLQIGCCQTLATLTGIRVIGQFRRKDMALGGQGAPLVPIFHQQLFPERTQDHVLVNIGGIANLTLLPKQGSKQTVLGFDTGPGNALLDDWFTQCHPHSTEHFDCDGRWGSQGNIHHGLLSSFIADSFIAAAAPKSSGREYFNATWLQKHLNSLMLTLPQQQQHLFTLNSEPDVQQSTIDAVDIQATLLAFTVQSIVDAIVAITPQAKIYVCGGGVHNQALMTLLEQQLVIANPDYSLKQLQTLMIDTDALEAMAFAWLAFAFDCGLTSNIPAATGASRECTLGCEFLP